MKWLTAGCLITTMFIFGSNLATAALGEHEKSIEKDRQLLHGATAKVTSHSLFQTHEMADPSGAYTVREYVSNDGTVFAVTWRGVSEPDLSQLLGSYFTEYKKGENQAKRPSRRSPKHVESDNVVVVKSGHMRDVRGKAYVPDLVPDGVDLQEIQ